MLMATSRLTFDCVDPQLLGHFWAAVTGYRLIANDAQLTRLQGDNLGLDQFVFREVERWKAAPNRLQLDLLADDVELEAQRLVQLGAVRVGEVVLGDERRMALRDPEGNEFSLVQAPLDRPARAPRRPSARRRGGGPPGRRGGPPSGASGGEEVA
jgi:hypothetical protein